MNDENIKLAIEGYNQEKMAIREFITGKDGAGFGVTDAQNRLQEIDQAILRLISL